MEVSADIYRPRVTTVRQPPPRSRAFFPSQPTSLQWTLPVTHDTPLWWRVDVVLVDSAGRLHVDADDANGGRHMIAIEISVAVRRTRSLPDAPHRRRAFNERLPLTGVILTKADGDARAAARRFPCAPLPARSLMSAKQPRHSARFHPERSTLAFWHG